MFEDVKFAESEAGVWGCLHTLRGWLGALIEHVRGAGEVRARARRGR